MSAPWAAVPLIGIDFTSRPSRRKPIVLAEGRVEGDWFVLGGLHRFVTDAAFVAWLQARPSWVGGFDLPFGLPRELVEQLGWPRDWAACIDHFAALPRPVVRATFAAFCAARPVGAKFAHRRCDIPAGSSPSMKWVNPPVAYMLHAGVPLLRQAGAWFPAHENAPANPQRVALEAYPGLVARAVLGRRSYKSDSAAGRSEARRAARQDLVEALVAGRHPLGLRLNGAAADCLAMVDEPGADALDAVLCLLQAAWAAARPGWGLPAEVDRLEGWIVGA